MGLLQKACETYDHHGAFIGVPPEGRVALTPVSHIQQKAQIEITLDREGAFIRAETVPKERAFTVIPATEESANRTGTGDRAHPLSDQLRYLTPYGGNKHNIYMEQLCSWAQSAQSHPKVRAILDYIRGGSILQDLARAGIITLDENDLPGEGKLENTEYDKCLVRWRVMGAGTDESSACWEDRSLFQAFIDYYQAQQKQQEAQQGLCMISGQDDTLAQSHPKGLVASSYGAKLISANDNSGFTYRGERFVMSWQAGTVGYQASQKAHNALRWVIADQGVLIGGRTFVCWNPKGYVVPPLISPFNRRDEAPPQTFPEYRERLQEALLGYQNDLPALEDVVVAAFEAATTGRLSVTYYNELRASDFIQRLGDWYRTCCWENRPFGIQSPPIRWIAARAFGVQREGKGHSYIEADDKVLKEHVQRLLRCIVDRAPISLDVVRALAQRASLPLAYTPENRNQVLFTACAVIRKYRNDIANKEEWTMQLDPQKPDRSYQFGRLLAVLEKVERDTYDREEKREPNAIRLQSVYCERPLNTAYIINDRLAPYFARHNPGLRNYYKNLIGEIFEQLSAWNEGELNRSLEDTYLLGYYLQRADLYRKKQQETEDA